MEKKAPKEADGSPSTAAADLQQITGANSPAEASQGSVGAVGEPSDDTADDFGPDVPERPTSAPPVLDVNSGAEFTTPTDNYARIFLEDGDAAAPQQYGRQFVQYDAAPQPSATAGPFPPQEEAPRTVWNPLPLKKQQSFDDYGVMQEPILPDFSSETDFSFAEQDPVLGADYAQRRPGAANTDPAYIRQIWDQPDQRKGSNQRGGAAVSQPGAMYANPADMTGYGMNPRMMYNVDSFGGVAQPAVPAQGGMDYQVGIPVVAANGMVQPMAVHPYAAAYGQYAQMDGYGMPVQQYGMPMGTADLQQQQQQLQLQQQQLQLQIQQQQLEQQLQRQQQLQQQQGQQRQQEQAAAKEQARQQTEARAPGHHRAISAGSALMSPSTAKHSKRSRGGEGDRPAELSPLFVPIGGGSSRKTQEPQSVQEQQAMEAGQAQGMPHGGRSVYQIQQQQLQQQQQQLQQLRLQQQQQQQQQLQQAQRDQARKQQAALGQQGGHMQAGRPMQGTSQQQQQQQAQLQMMYSQQGQVVPQHMPAYQLVPGVQQYGQAGRPIMVAPAGHLQQPMDQMSAVGRPEAYHRSSGGGGGGGGGGGHRSRTGGSAGGGGHAQPCRYFSSGYCVRGDKCGFAHVQGGRQDRSNSRRGGKRGQTRSPVNHAPPPTQAKKQPVTDYAARYTSIEEVVGQVYRMCKDQHGCRFLQKKLEEKNARVVAIVFDEVYDYIVELMTDPFGNYLCQKLIEHCNEKQQLLIVQKVASSLVAISKNMHGTRAVQKMIECLCTPAQVQLVVNALKSHVVELIQDLNGNHVIQRCLNRLSTNDKQFVYDAVAANCVAVATHRHGCCVMQRCIDFASEEQKLQLVQQIAANVLTLVKDPFGNYVVQYVLDLPFRALTSQLIRNFGGHLAQLSTQKFSSNVIEKCLRAAEPDVRAMMVEELIGQDALSKLLQDPYGNYVIQTALTVADSAQRQRLVAAIKPHMPALRNTPYGKRIQNKILKEGGM
eukprot:CAMPEP_0114630856 /NCGR_PEP_ID=MMETSP0168-20121206/14107_1 /TAXON_ID=95228 ORGANISM="Vannella sp., Strain DIVA3 517/6/12" /NCGR_SAMPLE_ID=MMETSP0168 /ASSEMBLY_ACC=CAM_ASM_000044 /LENGTH=990 /DNA_ID=CAMNT_0001842393 /DNA_START=92 /DNA_END=3064 /DNA_ORIENTATION=+